MPEKNLYNQVLETVELGLIKGEYNFCIEYIYPRLESYPPSSKEGANLRTILITALCAINKKDEAKKYCKELLRSNDFKIKENAKYLIEIIESPEIKKPENWNIKFETNLTLNKESLNTLKPKNIKKEKKKFINTSNIPTGETRPFQRGFIFIISLLLLLLIPLLSGCVKIEDTLDLSEIGSINNNFSIESKYIKKFTWQINFEETIKDIIPESELSVGELNSSLKSNNLNLENTKNSLFKIQKTASDLFGISTDLQINNFEKDYIFFKKYNFKIDLDLKTLQSIEDLEINFIIINPNKVFLKSDNNPQIKVSKNFIKWILIPGKINSLEFSFWNWNKLLLGFLIIASIISLAYFVRFYRYQIGTDLPGLPSS